MDKINSTHATLLGPAIQIVKENWNWCKYKLVTLLMKLATLLQTNNRSSWFPVDQ